MSASSTSYAFSILAGREGQVVLNFAGRQAEIYEPLVIGRTTCMKILGARLTAYQQNFEPALGYLVSASPTFLRAGMPVP